MSGAKVLKFFQSVKVSTPLASSQSIGLEWNSTSAGGLFLQINIIEEENISRSKDHFLIPFSFSLPNS